MLATACAEDIEPSIPQHNPQEPIFNASNVEVVKAGALASDAVLDLESYKASNEIPVMQLAKADSLPAGATVSCMVEISDTQDFARSKVLTTTPGTPAEDGKMVYYASATEWNDAQVFLMGKSPKVKDMYYRVPVYINVDGSDYRLNSVNYYAAEGIVKETCFDMGFVIEDHYYLLSNATTWDLENADEVKKYSFSHSEYDVYDDPIFEIRFKVSQEVLDANGGDYWKIAPESAVGTNNWDAMIGAETDGDTALSGHLVSDEAQSGKLTQAGSYKMIINMEAMTYEITYLAQPDFMYTPGDANGWSFDACAYMQLKSDKGLYYGVFPMGTYGFKICAEPGWDIDKSTNYGAVSQDPANSGSFVAGDAGQNIVPLTLGLNWINAKYDPIGYQLTTYEITTIETVGVIGSFAASGWGSDVVMSSSDGGNTWTADIEFKAGDKYKFRFNGNWDYNLGGDTHQLTLDGSDIEATEDGTYTLTLNLGNHYPSCTLTKK